jgi:ubiquinone/menaquinone biosynthesis C-methylase UbiE
MPQTWNPETYSRDAAFVPQLGSGVLEWLAPQSGERILDLGCGDGQLTERIAATGANVTGIDASPNMVASARARGIAAEEGSAESLPFADQYFDAVF